MTIFSSGKHPAVSADQRPYRNRIDGSRWPDPGVANLRDIDLLPFAPRPEFDRPLTNAANPILVDARESIERSKLPGARRDAALLPEGAIRIAIAFGVDAIKYTPSRGVTPEHIAHARRVLARFIDLHAASETP